MGFPSEDRAPASALLAVRPDQKSHIGATLDQRAPKKPPMEPAPRHRIRIGVAILYRGFGARKA